jgi:hypothetical protein
MITMATVQKKVSLCRKRLRQAVGAAKVRTANAQANPLLLSGPPCRLDGASELNIALVQIVDHLLTLMLDIANLFFLLDNQGIHILEQLGQLDHLLLNLLDRGMTILNRAEDGSGLPAAVTLHQSLLEDLGPLGCILDGSANLLLRCVGSHYAVLACHLILRSLAERRLNLLVLLNGLLETPIDARHLRRVPGLLAVPAGLDRAYSFSQTPVQTHRLCGKTVQLSRGSGAGRGIGIVEGAVLKQSQLAKVAFNLVDALVDVATFIQNGIGIALAKAAGVLRQGRHFNVVSC